MRQLPAPTQQDPSRPGLVSGPNHASLIPFDYVVTLNLTANQQGVQQLQLNQDSYFELHNIMGSSSIDAATDIHPNNFSTQIVDTSTGRNFSNAAVPQCHLCGPANGSIREYRPLTFSPNTVLQFTVNETSGNAAVVTITLRGYKKFNA